MTNSARTESWRQLLADNSDGNPVEFLLAWLQRESDGSSCSVGSTAQMQRDGYAREAGIFQLYFETADDNRWGATSAQLHVGCNGQTATRALTDDEKLLQVTSGVAYVSHCREVSNAQLDAQSLAWNAADFWSLVKLQHALPGIPKSYLPAAARAGRAVSWAEFRAYVEGLSGAELAAIDHGTAAYAPFGRLFDNAEQTGAAAAGDDADARGGGWDLTGCIGPVLALVAAFFLGRGLPM